MSWPLAPMPVGGAAAYAPFGPPSGPFVGHLGPAHVRAVRLAVSILSEPGAAFDYARVLAYANELVGAIAAQRWAVGNAYSLASLNATADGLLAESWVQGSLVGGVRAVVASGVATAASVLLLDDTPNCDLRGAPPCAESACAPVMGARETRSRSGRPSTSVRPLRAGYSRNTCAAGLPFIESATCDAG